MKFAFTSTFRDGYQTVNIHNGDYRNYRSMATVSQAKGCKSAPKDICIYSPGGIIDCPSEEEVGNMIVGLSSELKGQTLDYKILRVVQRVCRNFDIFWHTPARLNKISPIEMIDMTYQELLQQFPPRPIKSNEDLAATQKVIDALIDLALPLSDDEADYLDVLGSLVYAYEQQQDNTEIVFIANPPETPQSLLFKVRYGKLQGTLLAQVTYEGELVAQITKNFIRVLGKWETVFELYRFPDQMDIEELDFHISLLTYLKEVASTF